jgi:hypothetical protein
MLRSICNGASAGATGGAAAHPAERLVFGEGRGITGRREVVGFHILGIHLHVSALQDLRDIVLWLGHDVPLPGNRGPQRRTVHMEIIGALTSYALGVSRRDPLLIFRRSRCWGCAPQQTQNA